MQDALKGHESDWQAQAMASSQDLLPFASESLPGTELGQLGALALPHVLQPWWDAQLAGLSADALHVALELGVFAQLDTYTTAEQLAQSLALEPVNTALLLELLWSVDMLERFNAENGVPQYRLHPRMEPYLLASAPLYCADALLFRHQVLRQTGAQLKALVRQGAPRASFVDSAAMQRSWARAARLQIAQEQRAVTVDVAKAILGCQPEFGQMRLMLDLGGGPGLVAIALSQLQPTLRGVVFDYPAVAEVAKENIERAGLSGRLQVRSGDLVMDDLDSGYDLIWCSSTLHFVPYIRAILTRLHAALAPKGMLICSHAEISRDAYCARPILHYYLKLRMQGHHVLPAGQLAAWLRQTGFVSVKQADGIHFPVTPITVLIARKGDA